MKSLFRMFKSCDEIFGRAIYESFPFVFSPRKIGFFVHPFIFAQMLGHSRYLIGFGALGYS